MKICTVTRSIDYLTEGCVYMVEIGSQYVHFARIDADCGTFISRSMYHKAIVDGDIIEEWIGGVKMAGLLLSEPEKKTLGRLVREYRRRCRSNRDYGYLRVVFPYTVPDTGTVPRIIYMEEEKK